MSGTKLRISFCAATLALACVRLQAQAPETSSTPAIKSKAEDVLLDVVVRDKKGRLVTNLKADDFQIFDNGEAKEIDGFRLVQGREAVTGGGTRTQLDPLWQIRLITMIFQSSSVDARRLAHDAAATLLNGELPQNVYVSVMRIDHRLEIVQGFTNDVSLLRKAIDRVAQNASTDFKIDERQLTEQLERQLDPNFDDPQVAVPIPAISGTPASSSMTQVLLSTYERLKSATAKETGRIDITAAEQYRLPGRKTILYFTEGGFIIPQGAEQWVKNPISIANHSKVSIYAIDTHGLTATDPNSDAITKLHQVGTITSIGVVSAADDRVGNADTAVESTRTNPQMNLAYIADSTGGALIANTNDFRGPIRKVVEDAQTHYEISYAPGIKNYDGSFHKISVKLKTPYLRVQSRSGYFALPPALERAAGTLQAYQVPLLAALSSPQLSHDFDVASSVMHFRDDQGQPVCILAIDVPLANLTLQPKVHDQFEGHLSYVALVKDENGDVLKEFHNEVPISVAARSCKALKAIHFVGTEHFDVPPGHYHVATAVLDSEDGNRIGVRKSSFVVVAPSAGLSLSSASFVRDMKDKEANTLESDPLLVGGKVVSPALRPLVVKGENATLPFYLVVYADKSVATPPKLIMEFSKDGQVPASCSRNRATRQSWPRPLLGGCSDSFSRSRRIHRTFSAATGHANHGGGRVFHGAVIGA